MHYHHASTGALDSERSMWFSRTFLHVSVGRKQIPFVFSLLDMPEERSKIIFVTVVPNWSRVQIAPGPDLRGKSE